MLCYFDKDVGLLPIPALFSPMAMRVLLTRSAFHLHTLTPKITSNFPIQKFQYFSTVSNPNPNPNPRIPNSPEFTQPTHDRKLISLSNLLQIYGFPQPQLHDFLTKNRFLLDFNSQEIENSLGIILFKFKINQNSLVSMICSCPGVLDLEFLKKWEMGFSEFGFSRVSPLVIRSVLEHSRRFGMDPDEFFRSVRVLKGLGFNDDTVSRVLEEFPRVMMMDELELQCGIEFLARIGIKRNGFDRVYNLCPWILGLDVEHRLKPLIVEFSRLGFSENVIRREISRDPGILSMELGELSRCLEFLSTLKCRVLIKEKICREGFFRAGYEVKLRVDCLCKHGLIRTEAFSVLWREPRLIIYETLDIEKKIEFFLHRMEYKVEWLVKVPEYLGVNFEKQILPRYNVIEYLRSKGGLGDRVGLNDLIKPSTLKFYNLYVKPYPECQKLFGRFSKDVEVKNRHPVGMWKLFKPQRYSESQEDVENIKSFMKS